LQANSYKRDGVNSVISTDLEQNTQRRLPI